MKTIPLTRGMRAIVDDEHFDYLSQWKWYAARTSDGFYYARRTISWRINGVEKTRKISMHREIAGVSGLLVDHINRDTLDNRSENLRTATNSQNLMNRMCRANIGLKGVRPKRGKFQAMITLNSKRMCLGTFTSPVDAAIAYNKAALRLFGDRALLNSICGGANAKCGG